MSLSGLGGLLTVPTAVVTCSSPCGEGWIRSPVRGEGWTHDPSTGQMRSQGLSGTRTQAWGRRTLLPHTQTVVGRLCSNSGWRCPGSHGRV